LWHDVASRSAVRPAVGSTVMQQVSWQMLADRIEQATDPVLMANLQIVAKHVVAEVAGDIPELMSTLVAEPVYRIWGTSESVGPRGRDQVEAHYRRLVASGKNRLEYHIGRVVVDQHSVVTEGEFRFAYQGSDLTRTSGIDTGLVDADGWYLVAYQCLVVWPIADHGLIAGEEIYTGEHPRVIKQLVAGEMSNLGPVLR
jgi:hypothetical protein